MGECDRYVHTDARCVVKYGLVGGPAFIQKAALFHFSGVNMVLLSPLSGELKGLLCDHAHGETSLLLVGNPSSPTLF